MKEHNVDRPAPLFILCPIRSFSSITCAMLGQHPQMYSFPELRLFNADTLQGVLHYHQDVVARAQSSEARAREPVMSHHVLFFRMHESPQEPARFSDGLLRALAELCFGGQTPEGVKQAESWLQERLDWGVQQVFDLLLDHIGPRTGVDKSPHTSMSPTAMQRVFRLYPQARFLHLTRHPVSTQRSMHQFFRPAFRKAYPEGDPRPLARHCAQLWRATHRGILDFTHALPAEQTLRVRGEDLLADPELHQAAISRWLGVASDPEAITAMKHPEHSPYASAGPDNASLGNDPKFLAEPQLRPVAVPSSLQAPPEWGLNADLQDCIEELAAELGYG